MTDSEETKRISYSGLRADEHDVLTDQGWLNISEVTMDSRVATLNSETNHIEYQNPLIVTEYDVDDKMYEVENRIISQCVTKNHGMFVSRRSSKNGKDVYLPYELMEPAKIHNKKRLKYKTNGTNNNPDIDSYSFCKTTVPMDLWLQYLGIWISDGYLNKDGVQINVSKPRKIKFITNILNAIGVEYKTYTYDYDDRLPRSYIRVTDHAWRHEFTALNVGAENKYLPDYVWKLSQRQSEILLNSLIEGDGTDDHGSLRFTTSSKKLVDDFQRLCIHSGYSGNSRLVNEAGYTHEIRGKEVTMKHDSYVISVIKKMCQPAIHDGKKDDSTIDRFIHYNGKVVYIQVPNYTLFVRRNGKVSITGC